MNNTQTHTGCQNKNMLMLDHTNVEIITITRQNVPFEIKILGKNI